MNTLLNKISEDEVIIAAAVVFILLILVYNYVTDKGN